MITDDKAGLRLQVYLAHAGVASRRACEALILRGRVSVNGSVVTELGTKTFAGDTVLLDGKSVTPETTMRYLALNKPAGYLCSGSDPQGRPLAKELLEDKGISERLYTVGRLDFLSRGLLLFTNDGDFAAKVSHPGSQIEKEYLVEASGYIPPEMPEAFLAGVEIDGVNYKCKDITFAGRKTLRIVLIEGKNREIRRVFSHFHLHPQTLTRVRIGPVVLGSLEDGASRALTRSEVQALIGNSHFNH
jgi:23S rRNA pseudouridine2605 synthase